MSRYMLKNPYVEACFYNGANLKKIKKFVGVTTRVVGEDEKRLRITTATKDVTLPVAHYLVKKNRHEWVVMDLTEFNRLYDKVNV